MGFNFYKFQSPIDHLKRALSVFVKENNCYDPLYRFWGGPRITCTIQRSSLTLNSSTAINGAVYCHFSIKWCLNSCIQKKSFLIHFLPQCEKWSLWIMGWKVYHDVKEHTLAPTLFGDRSHTIFSTFHVLTYIHFKNLDKNYF